MYALTGANGQLGRLVLQHLLTQVPADQIIATTRDPHTLADMASRGVIVRRADFSDPATLAGAFVGARRLLMISVYVAGRSVELHQAAIAAAVEAGVDHLVYTSTPHADSHSAHPLLADHGQTEAALAASGVPWTALRNSFYAEILRDFIAFLLVKGRFLVPEGSAKHCWISRDDCARAATGALVGTLTETGPVDVTGPEALSFADLATRLSRLSHGQITPHPVAEHDLLAQVTAKGIPDAAARATLRLISWIAQGGTEAPTDTVVRASGTKPASIDPILRTLITA